MHGEISFSAWLKRRRKSLDLTQGLLAQRVHCSLATIQKIETGERRPSHQLAGLLAEALEIPAQDRPLFLKVARGELADSRLAGLPAPGGGPEEAGKPLLPARWNNLPIPAAPLIGRQAELDELARLMAQPDCRLLTIAGAGGTGKTRLALSLAESCGHEFMHGVCFVPLAPLTLPDFIASAIASALNLTASGSSEEPSLQLLTYLREKELLLVLDSLEHLLSNIGFLADILQAAPGVKLLATSRERLNLQDEWVFDLRGLPVPEPGDAVEVEDSSAVQLFLYAARRIRSGFSLTGQNREAVARICQLVDGMPLGLELAAAWTHVLSCQEIADEIQGSLDFLSASSRDRPVRHRSMRAVFDHSWRLLSPEEQQVMRRLSVFRGSFKREAAGQVTGATLPVLSSLTDKSLLHHTDAGLYDLHELVRQYSAAKLSETGEEPTIRQKHFDYYAALAESAAPHLTTAQWKLWVDRLETEYDNLRAALEWSQRRAKDNSSLLQLAGALHWFWHHRGDLSEGRAWLEHALARAGDSAPAVLRARALFGAGCLAYMQGENSTAWLLLDQSAALWRFLGDSGQPGLAYALVELGELARHAGDLAAAHALVTEGVALFRGLDDHWGLAYALDYLAMVLRDETDYPEARALAETSIALWRQLGDEWGLAYALHTSGLVALRQGDYAAARSRCEEALPLRQRAGNRPGLAYSLHTLGVIALNQGDQERAKPYFEQSQALFKELGDRYGFASALQFAGFLAVLDGDAARAQPLIEQALAIGREVGPRWFSGYCLARLAGVAAVLGHPIPAVRLWEAADTIMTASASYMDAADRIFYECTIAPACLTVSAEAIEAARSEGRSLDVEQAIAYAASIFHPLA